MKVDERKESAIRLSLIDVIYGVVLTYGFQYFDQINWWVSYLLFGFAYLIIIIDWLYVHTRYWGEKYKNIVFSLDVCILFLFSRLIYTSFKGDSMFWFWLSIVFVFYAFWDWASQRMHMSSKYDWRYSLAGDLFGFVAMLGFYLFKAYKLLFINPWILSGAIFYIIVLPTWFIPKDDVSRREFFRRLFGWAYRLKKST